MKYLLLLLIRLYWLLPKAWRRRCIFKCTCSHYVFQITRQYGFIAGIKALRKRYKQCRPGYNLYQTPDYVCHVILADKTVIPFDETNL
jgi:putative component of membrane protein insertase Oxa1/YidC/SpoIIIJ protein YidD